MAVGLDLAQLDPILKQPLRDLLQTHAGSLIVALVGEKAIPHEAAAWHKDLFARQFRNLSHAHYVRVEEGLPVAWEIAERYFVMESEEALRNSLAWTVVLFKQVELKTLTLSEVALETLRAKQSEIVQKISATFFPDAASAKEILERVVTLNAACQPAFLRLSLLQRYELRDFSGAKSNFIHFLQAGGSLPQSPQQNPRQMLPQPRLSPHSSPQRPSLGFHPTKERDRVLAVHEILKNVEECEIGDRGLRGLFAVCMNRTNGQTESEKAVVALLPMEIQIITFDLLVEAAFKITSQERIPLKGFPLSHEEMFPLQRARNLIVQALVDKGELMAQIVLAKIFIKKNDLARAKESLDRIVSQQYLNSFALIQRGILTSQGKLGIAQDLEEAIFDFKTVLNQTKAKREQVLELLADVLCREGLTQNLTEAIECYREILKSNPQNMRLVRKIAERLVGSGKRTEAFQFGMAYSNDIALQAFIRQDPNLYKQATEADPTDVFAWANYGCFLIDSDTDAALQCFRTALELDPSCATANAGMARLSDSNEGQRHKYLQKARAKDPANEGVRKIELSPSALDIAERAYRESPDDFYAVIPYLDALPGNPEKIRLLKEVYPRQKDNLEFMAQLAFHVYKKHSTIALSKVVDKDLNNGKIFEYYLAQLIVKKPQSHILKHLREQI